MDGYERFDVIEDGANFLKQMKELKPYMIEFHDNDTMKLKVYLSDCEVKSENCQLIIVITYDECIFSTDNCA